MRRDLLDSGQGADRLDVTPDVREGHRLALAVRGWEEQVRTVRHRPPGAQDAPELRVQRDEPLARELSEDAERALDQVDVGPSEGLDLAATEASVEPQSHDRPSALADAAGGVE